MKNRIASDLKLYFQGLNYFPKLLVIFGVFVLLSCGGGLTDEQRKKIKEEMDTSQIKRISEAEITEAVLVQGRELTKLLEQKASSDSLAKANSVTINWLDPDKATASEIESQLIDAYLTGLSGGTMDNVQRIGNDSLLYTFPVIEKQADSIDRVKGIWSIYFSRKQIVLNL